MYRLTRLFSHQCCIGPALFLSSLCIGFGLLFLLLSAVEIGLVFLAIGLLVAGLSFMMGMVHSDKLIQRYSIISD